MHVADVVKASDEPAFSVDQDCRIGGWNTAMARLFGLQEKEVVGKRCHGVISSCDPFGNRFCGENCPVMRMARRGEPIHRFRLKLPTALCQLVDVWVSVIALPRADRPRFDLVHLISPVTVAAVEPKSTSGSHYGTEILNGRLPASRNRLTRSRLTRRESEVLQLLAAGHGTSGIADLLFISPHTVRNHIRAILGKLKAHSRLEAVSLAQRRGLI